MKSAHLAMRNVAIKKMTFEIQAATLQALVQEEFKGCLHQKEGMVPVELLWKNGIFFITFSVGSLFPIKEMVCEATSADPKLFRLVIGNILTEMEKMTQKMVAH